MDILEKAFLKTYKISATNISCEVSELIRVTILKNNQKQLLFYGHFYRVHLSD